MPELEVHMAKSIWSGAISFGLVNIPVRLYRASKDREFKFHLLHSKDHSEIRYARICKEDGKEIPWDEIVKGYEIAKGQYVVMDEKDFEKAYPKKSKTIEILNFTEEQGIDTIYFQTPYYLEPEKGAAKAYILLREALAKSKKVAVGNFVFRNHEHIGIIKPEGNFLVLVQLRFHEDLLGAEIEVPKEKAVNKRELDMALQFIEKMSEEFVPKKYKDTTSAMMRNILKGKSKGKKFKVKKEKPSPKIQDIMELLEKSVKSKRKSA
jgi:DNA end-binding protein Ku